MFSFPKMPFDQMTAPVSAPYSVYHSCLEVTFWHWGPLGSAQTARYPVDVTWMLKDAMAPSSGFDAAEWRMAYPLLWVSITSQSAD